MAPAQAMSGPPDIMQLLAHRIRWQLLSALARSDQRVSELVCLVGQPMNLVSYHLKRLKQEGLVVERRSSYDSRAVYYSADLNRLRALFMASGEALHPTLGGGEAKALAENAAGRTAPARVLFLCTHNSARSQMAEAITRHLGSGRVVVFSAGSEPAVVHPDALQVLNAMRIDTARLRSKPLDEFRGQSFDYIITVCDRVRENCPVFPGDPQRIHWSFPDPVEVKGGDERYRAFVVIANEIKRRVEHLLVLIDREWGQT